MQFKAIRGTHDILPEESPSWQWVEAAVRKVTRLYGFEEIRTPTFEETALFVKGTGETSDIVGKEMYTFEDLGGRSLTLVPEGTPPIIRAYLEHNLGAKSPLVKVFYIARMYRQENPQAGRLRQHHQFGAEAVGSPSPLQDLELITLLLQVHSESGLKETQLRINSIGCPKCRPGFRDALLRSLGPRLTVLCDDCQKRYERNPLRILDCKQETCQEALEGVPDMLDFLCEECRPHFDAVRRGLERLHIPYVLDQRLVRGLDYYTRTVFEVTSNVLGAQNSLGGGGRYDGLVETLGGPPTPGVGFGAGIERLLLALQREGSLAPQAQGIQVFIAALGPEAAERAWGLACALRRAGYSCEMDTLSRSLKSQMRAADKVAAKKVLILGENELQQGLIIIRDMQTHQQIEIPLDEVVEQLGIDLG